MFLVSYIEVTIVETYQERISFIEVNVAVLNCSWLKDTVVVKRAWFCYTLK